LYPKPSCITQGNEGRNRRKHGRIARGKENRGMKKEMKKKEISIALRLRYRLDHQGLILGKEKRFFSYV
jgi:hypothetical protein